MFCLLGKGFRVHVTDRHGAPPAPPTRTETPLGSSVTSSPMAAASSPARSPAPMPSANNVSADARRHSER